MSREDFVFWTTVGGALCWGICFLWMHRISSKQNALLAELREQAGRIETLSQEEHDLIKEVHPKVGDIKAGVDEVVKQLGTDDRPN